MDDPLILGGGPAGASLAIRLATAGRSVRLIEREAGARDKVCGEFLSFEAQGYLAELGIDLPALGAIEIAEVGVFRRGRRAFATLPFRARGLSRRIMDEALLARAAAAGAAVERGQTVTRLERVGQGWRIRTEDGRSMQARQVFVATGKHDLRGWRRPPGSQPDFIGFKQHWRLASAQTAALEGRVELHLFPDGYAGLEPSGSGHANLCLIVRERAFMAAGGSWAALMAMLAARCPSLAERLEGAEAVPPKPLAIGSLPYGHLQRRSDGLWRLGDQAVVIPSFTGEGISIALHSARLASEAVLCGRTAESYQRALAKDIGRQVRRAVWISRALVRPAGQALATALLQVQPRTIGAAAAATRIPGAALDRRSR